MTSSINSAYNRPYSVEPPDMSGITPEEIARSLSLVCRFSGNLRAHYSVAQHSVYVAAGVPQDLRKFALLHDAAEMVTSDIPTPVKELMHVKRDDIYVPFRAWEDEILLSVCNALDVEWPTDEQLKRVKQEDVAVRSQEDMDLRGIGPKVSVVSVRVKPMAPDAAMQLWLSAWRAER